MQLVGEGAYRAKQTCDLQPLGHCRTERRVCQGVDGGFESETNALHLSLQYFSFLSEVCFLHSSSLHLGPATCSSQPRQTESGKVWTYWVPVVQAQNWQGQTCFDLLEHRHYSFWPSPRPCKIWSRSREKRAWGFDGSTAISVLVLFRKARA